MEEKRKYLLYQGVYVCSAYDDNMKVKASINATEKEISNLVDILNKEDGESVFLYNEAPKEFHSCSDYLNWWRKIK